MKKISGQVKGLKEKPLTPPSLLFRFIPLDFCLWLKQHGLKTEKENIYAQQSCGVIGVDCTFVWVAEIEITQLDI